MPNTHFPAIRADAQFERSALSFAHQTEVNAVELDALAQVVIRLARDQSTVAANSLLAELAEFVELGYIAVEPTTSSTVLVDLMVPGALLTNYFWAVWVPRHLFSRSLKVAVAAKLPSAGSEQQYTIAFRIPGTREDGREFLANLARQYPDDAPEIVAIQAGNALEEEKTDD